MRLRPKSGIGGRASRKISLIISTLWFFFLRLSGDSEPVREHEMLQMSLIVHYLMENTIYPDGTILMFLVENDVMPDFVTN